MASNEATSTQSSTGDLEAGRTAYDKDHSNVASFLAVEPGAIYKPDPQSHPKWYQRLLDAGVEENGVKPVPIERRTNTSYNNLFSVFFTALLCVLP